MELALEMDSMEVARQQREPLVRPGPTRADRPARLRGVGRLILLILVLGLPAGGQTVDTYGELLDRHFAEQPEAPGPAGPAKMTAEEWRVYDLDNAIKREAQRMAQGPLVEEEPPPDHNDLALVMAVLVAAVAGIGKLVEVFSRRFRFQTESDERWQNLLAEDPSLAAFFTELRDGLNASARHSLSGALDSLNGIGDQITEDTVADPLQEFFAAAPSQVANLRTLFSEISRAADEGARQDILLEFVRQVGALKELAQLPEVRPFGLVAYALAGLLKQLSTNPSEVTPSVLRTVAGAVDLLQALCIRGLNPDLATEPPVRLLAVDDDAVSRLAISFALRKAFNEPDLAPDGEAALGLIASQNYDVIFLDVDMPGMDGFELCTKIRQAAGHRATPVVFVTRHSDFNSRAKSTQIGRASCRERV